MQTRGVYYRLPVGASHLAFPHWFGSIAWNDGEGKRDGFALGELPGRYYWVSGRAVGRIPPAIAIGGPECFRNGERYPLPVIDRVIVDGYDTRCWTLPPDRPAPNLELLDVGNRANWIRYAAILEQSYSDPAGAAAALELLVGPSGVVTYVPNGPGPYTGSWIAVGPDFSIMLVSGTTNDTQWLLQIVTAALGPVNFGQFATSPTWWNNATVLDSRASAAGVDPTKPLLIVGHSYGGASGSVLAGRYAFGGRPGSVSLLTYAMPKPGDGRLANLLRETPQTHIAAIGDPVPWLPPGPQDFLPVPIAVPATYVHGWGRWVRPHGQLQLDSQGAVQPWAPGLLAYLDSYAATAYAILATPWALPSFHEIKTYIDWLSLQP